MEFILLKLRLSLDNIKGEQMYFTYENAKIRELIDKTLDSVTLSTDDSLVFKTTDGVTYKLYHEQECCEYVYIKDG